MRQVRRQLLRQSAATGLLAAGAAVLVGLLMTGCGSTATARTAAATATPTCPPVNPTRTVSGSVQAVSSGSFTLSTAAGASVTVHLTSNTVMTRQVSTSTASLATGQAVEVVTDSSGVTALRVVVVGTTGGTRQFGGRGTPVARGNPSCFRRGAGSGLAPGSASFSGIRGTLTTVSDTQLVLSDAQGQSYTVAVTPSTVIISLSKATASNLAVGDPVTAVGTTTANGITARTIMIGLPSPSNS